MRINLPPGAAAQCGPVLSIPVVAKQLDISTKTVRRLIASGELPHHRIGRQIRISEQDLNIFIALRRRVGKDG